MSAKKFCVKCYHQGDFKNNTYIGGQVTELYRDEDIDLISYTSLMSDVAKKMKYAVIGGLYVKTIDKMGFKLLWNDDDDVSTYLDTKVASKTLEFFIDHVVDDRSPLLKQTQPFVVVRPRKLPIEAGIPPRRSPRSKGEKQFVTLKSIQDQTRKRIAAMGKNKELERKQDLVVDSMPLLEEMGDEEMGDSDDVEEAAIVAAQNYEQFRNETIAKNKKKIAELRIKSIARDISNSGNEKAEKTNAELKIGKQVRKKKEISSLNVTRRTTRSLTHAIEEIATKTTTDDATKQCVQKRHVTTEEPRTEVPRQFDIFHLRQKRDEGVGTMENYLALRERQKNPANQPQMESIDPPIEVVQHGIDPIMQSASQPSQESGAPIKKNNRKFRGKTRLNAVHTRHIDERKVIFLNDENQPIGDNDDLKEFSNFLGTLAGQYIKFSHVNWSKVPDKEILWQYVQTKYSIHEDGKTWVMNSISSSWKGHKSRLKTSHYKAYDNDEDRLANKPDELPIDEFKVLLKYWGDKKVQERARKMAENRKCVKDTHTAGRKSFARIKNDMTLKNPNKVPPSDAELYIETRKRKPGRSYKASDDHAKSKIARLEDIQSLRGENSAQPCDSSQGSSKLLGRRGKSMKQKGPALKAPTELVTELRTSIKQEVRLEMQDEMNQKMTFMMKHLARLNPTLNIDFDSIIDPLADSASPSNNVLNEATNEDEGDDDQ